MKTALRLASVRLFAVLILSFSCIAGVSAQGPSGPDQASNPSGPPKYKNATLPIPDRVADLLPRMTLQEKVDQLKWDWQQKVDVIDPTGTYNAESARKTLAAEWGEELKLTPRNAAILRNAIQRYQIEKTRLGIPVIFPGEALHG